MVVILTWPQQLLVEKSLVQAVWVAQPLVVAVETMAVVAESAHLNRLIWSWAAQIVALSHAAVAVKLTSLVPIPQSSAEVVPASELLSPDTTCNLH